MRKACGKLWRAVPCSDRKSLGGESKKDIEELLKGKLSSIKEEPECEEKPTAVPRHRRIAKKQGKMIESKDKAAGCLMVPHVSVKQSYILFITGVASKGTFGGLLKY